MRYVRGHNTLRGVPWFNAHTGRWYVYDRAGGRTPWARTVLEDKLGRTLRDDEHAHHINGDKTDDRPENLEDLTISEHAKRHLMENGAVTNQYGTWSIGGAQMSPFPKSV